ncbi:MAG: tRNA (adenosine(37)-N6)-threonylcarbamoyltransferase complex ATPase subunit type 1 TsaE [Polyangiaceae bacterium]|nr:tRNA (adenosine(37)-N6)-threonylcarbamoyltransferase complex ATPase subunit type 1 TsaE [Polyangiaceae bacterium]
MRIFESYLVRLATRRDTTRLGTRIAKALEPTDLVMISGPLGAGKTFLARAMARALGVPPSVAIASPTFTLMQEYETPHVVFAHADLFRLREQGANRERTALEISRLGLAERRGDGVILVVEWGEGFESELGGHVALNVQLAIKKEVREATVSGPKALLVSS